MTGWAQVHGLHGDTSIFERARFDNQYIEYWSPWLDVVILARTLAAVDRGRPAAGRRAMTAAGRARRAAPRLDAATAGSACATCR